MKIQVAKQDLMEALSVALTSMHGSGADLSTHCLFRPSEDDPSRAEVLTYSPRCFSKCPFVADVDVSSGHEAFTIEGKRLRRWVDAVPDVALTFEFDGTSVKATAPGRGTQKFQSLDPDNWPYWDSLVQEAKAPISIGASRLASALDHCRQFASDQESRSPEMCVCEVKDGVLASTNKIAASLITVEGLAESTMRIHAKDTPGILSFLATIQGDVEVLEGDSNIFFRRADGTIYGESRFQAQFPGFSRPDNSDMHWWDLKVEDLKSGIPFLTSGAAWEDNRLCFIRDGKDGPVTIAMMTTSGSMTSVEVECVESGKIDGVEPLPEEGFVLAYPLLSKVLSLYGGDVIRLGLTSLERGGYVRIMEKKFQNKDGSGGDTYLTILVWLR